MVIRRNLVDDARAATRLSAALSRRLHRAIVRPTAAMALAVAVIAASAAPASADFVSSETTIDPKTGAITTTIITTLDTTTITTVDPKSGTNLANQVVLVEGDRIADVGPASRVSIPPGARVIDLRATGTVIKFDGFLTLYQEGRDDDPEDEESRRPFLSGFVVKELFAPSNWRSRESLDDYLRRHGVPGIAEIDTRALVRRLRETGTQRGVLRQSRPGGFVKADFDELRRAAQSAPSVSQLELVSGVSGVLPVTAPRDDVVVLDCGAKWNILRSLEARGVAPRVYRWDAPAEAILERKPRAILLSSRRTMTAH